MALVERRALADFQDRHWPGIVRKIQAAAGFPVTLDVKWDQLMVDGQSDRFVACWQAVYFDPLIAGMGRVNKDELGRAALKSGIKKIVIQNDAGNRRPDMWAALKDGVLTLDHEPLVNMDDRQLRAGKLGDLLEAKL